MRIPSQHMVKMSPKAVFFLFGLACAGHADPSAVLRFDIVGIQLAVDPSTLTVPKDIATHVNVSLQAPVGAGQVFEPAIAKLREGAEVRAKLRGPGISTVDLHAPAGQPLPIPPLRLPGDYLLTQIRLVKDGAVVLEATPDVVPIKVINEILVTRVQTRPLSLDEIFPNLLLDWLGHRVEDEGFDQLMRTPEAGANFLAALGEVAHASMPGPSPRTLLEAYGAQTVPREDHLVVYWCRGRSPRDRRRGAVHRSRTLWPCTVHFQQWLHGPGNGGRPGTTTCRCPRRRWLRRSTAHARRAGDAGACSPALGGSPVGELLLRASRRCNGSSNTRALDRSPFRQARGPGDEHERHELRGRHERGPGGAAPARSAARLSLS